MQTTAPRLAYQTFPHQHQPHHPAFLQSQPLLDRVSHAPQQSPLTAGWPPLHHPLESPSPLQPQQIWLPISPQSQHFSSPTSVHHGATSYDMALSLVSPVSNHHPDHSQHHHHQQQRSPLGIASKASLITGLPSPEQSPRGPCRPQSPGHADLNLYGFMNPEGTWTCAYPGCTSRAVFTRGCDLRKHHKRHTKSFFCRYPGCTQASGGGFSSKKDLARHEAKHNPGVVCEWAGCDRIFSRVDNMRDHVKRIHLKSYRVGGRKAAAAAAATRKPQPQQPTPQLPLPQGLSQQQPLPQVTLPQQQPLVQAR